ncbi:MAG: CPBP family intramembrane metalloprotease [Gammaproteobacteria bacterium]|nr:CPBP family intramembrane metalloprotease [Gammaproteobacteria bacterium]MDD9894605.1 CPBP family intramembrane metalloprotease [Gammaproteobacteria bacterium]MDD9957853.1 CPBP family intramembrane metalloprotease [Gammaproteobacteria bacterium]
MFWNRIAALAEVLLILALGNLVGEALFAATLGPVLLAESASDLELATADGLLIFFRLGLAAAFGFTLLYLRRGITPRQAGVSLNNHSLGYLLQQGVVVGLFSSFFIALLFATHRIVPLGEGLAAWWTYNETPINLTFLVYFLGTSFLIPPLTEEIMTRGYFRVRMVESYGVIAGVILTGLVFGLSHTSYLNGDSMLALFMLLILINSVVWTYLAQKTGSVLPPMIAHAIGNGVGTAVLFNIWIPFLIVTIGLVLVRKSIAALLAEILQAWKTDAERNSLWQGLLIVVLILGAALVSLAQIGRTPTLLGLGMFCIVITLVNLVLEKKQVDGNREVLGAAD